MERCYLAVDIGASSGRHVVGWLEEGRLVTREVCRFENGTVRTAVGDCWNVEALVANVFTGMRACLAAGFTPVSVGVDTWGVDYVLLDERGQVACPVYATRNNRTVGADREVERALPFAELYGITGIQKMRFNTVYQLFAHLAGAPQDLKTASAMLLMPDYIHYRLSGARRNEYSEATTTSLVDVRTGGWHFGLIERLGLPRRLFGEIVPPGTVLGTLTEEARAAAGFDCRVVAPASHDTQSAFLAAPAADPASCVTISSGTWSLLGFESDAPVLRAPDGRQTTEFSNEGGYGGKFNVLKNIMGLWMIQSLRREYGNAFSFADLERMARESDFSGVVDAEDERFMNPVSMAEELGSALACSGQARARTPGDQARCVYLSLARCYAKAVREIGALRGAAQATAGAARGVAQAGQETAGVLREAAQAGQETAGVLRGAAQAIHIVGGGSQDAFLNQLTADAAGVPVHAGPTEGTVVGNLMAQMIADGIFSDVKSARAVVRESFGVRVFEPGAGA